VLGVRAPPLSSRGGSCSAGAEGAVDHRAAEDTEEESSNIERDIENFNILRRGNATVVGRLRMAFEEVLPRTTSANRTRSHRAQLVLW